LDTFCRYAEGKVCLSLLGTWSGPGWEPDVSTLSQVCGVAAVDTTNLLPTVYAAQVLISVQSQIMNDQPYFNEPSYEGIAGTDNGKRCVAKHNTQIRLGTIRYAMLEHLKKAPLGFERAVQAHFYFKRDELRAQVTQWVAEAKALALYDYEVTRAPAAAKAAYNEALKAELAKFVPAAPVKQAGKKRGRAVAYGGYDSITGQVTPAGFVRSKQLEALADAYTRIAHGSAVSSWAASTAFTCFARGLGAMPKTSIQSFIPGQDEIQMGSTTTQIILLSQAPRRIPRPCYASKGYMATVCSCSGAFAPSRPRARRQRYTYLLREKPVPLAIAAEIRPTYWYLCLR
jgi:hypothetical protein